MIYSIKDHIDRLCDRSKPPESDEEFEAWVTLSDVLDILQADLGQDDMIVYADLGGATFMHAVTVPSSYVDEADIDRLCSGNFNAYNGWGVSYGFSDPPEVSIEPPLSGEYLEGAEQLVFLRIFEGHIEEHESLEILQKIPHIFGIYWVAERNAYCKIDKNGDLENVISVRTFDEKKDGLHGRLVTFRRDLLNDFMNLTKSVLVRTFDFSRFRSSNFMGYGGDGEEERDAFNEIHYRSFVMPGHASYMRGAQVIRPSGSMRDFIRRLERKEVDPEYASFIAMDVKNNRVTEISCAPGCTATYFMKSDLPFEISPAFFRPEVLLKYKADPDKYVVQDRHIRCRGAWDLRTYDINNEGQVHTYIRYLRDLPYSEQLYWKTYNEPPKTGISKRAYQTDIEGKWSAEYDPLNSLLHSLSGENNIAWWSLRSEQLPGQINYPATSSSAEWGTEITRLDQLLVEGMEEKYLRKKATDLGRKVDKFRSLKLVEECLVGLGFDEERAREVMGPLHELHNLRSEVGGAHASGKSARAKRKSVLAEHGTYRAHFQSLCADCDETFETISNAMQ